MERELDKVLLRPSTSKHPVEKRKKTTVTPVLVVAIDEARSLLEIKDNNGNNALQLLRRALIKVNLSSTVKGKNGLVFGFLVDTNPRVHEYAAAPTQGLPSLYGDRKNPVPFPPFVLTETMDIMMKKLGDAQRTSRSRVLTTDEYDVWTALVSMGRPLWRSMDDTRKVLSSRKAEMALFAAKKLLIGLPSYNSAGYTASTFYGVSSLLCRLGLRPCSFSPTASLLVANMMNYVSDPILTFGASKVWHEFELVTSSSALECYILPQFQTMLLNGEIDASNIGEPVPRIFLLLAMDAVAMGSSDKRRFFFSGEFCDVLKFVEVLVGHNPQIRAGESEVIDEEKIGLCKDWVESWKGWQTVEQPASCLVSNSGADLIIPIFHPKDCDFHPEGSVSFILVQDQNRVDGDDPESALRKLEPSYVFEKTDDPNSLHTTSNNGIIRLYLSLCEVANEATTPAQSIVASPDNATQKFDGLLCVRGVLASNSDEANDELNQRHPFLSKGLVEKLRELANSAWWDVRHKSKTT